MTKDGFIRRISDGADRIAKVRESAERAAKARDTVQVSAVPRVFVDKRMVRLDIGARWLVYGIEQNGRASAVTYLPEFSRPPEQLTPGPFGELKPMFDPAARDLLSAALQAWKQATGQTASGFFYWDYRASLDARGQVRADLPTQAQAQTRALMRLDVRRRGIVTATQQEVAWEMAKELSGG